MRVCATETSLTHGCKRGRNVYCDCTEPVLESASIDRGARVMFKAAHTRVPEPREILTYLSQVPGWLWRYLTAVERRPLWLFLLTAALACYVHLDLLPLGPVEVRYLDAATQQERLLASGDNNWFATFLSIPLGPARDPRYAATFLSAISIASLIVLFEALNRHCRWRVAVLTTGLLAAAPWFALLNRQIQPPALAIPLAACLLSGFVAALCGERPWGWTVAWASAIGLAVLSPDGFPTLLAALLITAAFRNRAQWLYVLLGVLLGMLLTLDAQYLAPDSTLWARAALFVTGSSPTSAPRDAPVSTLARLLGGGGLDLLAEGIGVRLAQLLATLSTLWGWICLLGILYCGWLAIRAWARWRERTQAHEYAIPVLWVLSAITVYVIRNKPVSVGELAALLPAGLLAFGLTIDHLLDQNPAPRQHARQILTATVAIVLISGAYRSISLYQQIADQGATAAYGTPFKTWRLLATLAIRAAPGTAEPLWILPALSVQERDQQTAVLDYLIAGQADPHYLNTASLPAMLLPAEREGYYLLIGDHPVQAETMDQLRAEKMGLVSPGTNASGATLYRLPERPAADLLATIQQRDWAAWEAGIRLVGYDLPAPARSGEAVVMTTYWTFDAIPPQDRRLPHALSMTIFDTLGNASTVTSQLGLDEHQWKPGLLLKQWHVLPYALDPAVESLVIEVSIDRADGYRSLLINDAGDPVSDRYTLGPFVPAP